MAAVRATELAGIGSTAPRAHVALPIWALGWSLSIFFSISFVLCVLGYLILPQLPVAHGALSLFFPGFQLDSWPRFFLGLVESFAAGWYIALVFGALYNFFVMRAR